MFTGIIECIGVLKKVDTQGSNISLLIKSSISKELKIDQSVSHNGVCLTVIEASEDFHKVIVIKESIKKSNLSKLPIGSLINLERAMLINSRLDGHIVQGHVDNTAVCVKIKDYNGSKTFTFEMVNQNELKYIVNKGSITINGISLTVSEVKNNNFDVNIIPYTLENTNMNAINLKSIVNIELDIVAKYVENMVKFSK